MSQASQREFVRGEEWIVGDIKVLRPMDLHLGYVPEDHVADSAPLWHGVPLLHDHPTDSDGNFVSASTVPSQWIGLVANTRFERRFVRGAAWLEVEAAG